MKCKCGSEVWSTGDQLYRQSLYAPDSSGQSVMIYAICAHGVVVVDRRAEFNVEVQAAPPEGTSSLRLTYVPGKQYIVWDAYEGQTVKGYYLGEGKVSISAPCQSWHTPIKSRALFFGDKVGSQLGGLHSHGVAVEACFFISCLTDTYLPKFKRPEAKE
jgi:hypothetical protein